MCECGCSAITFQAKMPGPDHSWYLVRRYPGCSDCGTPAGIDIMHVTAEVCGDEEHFQTATCGLRDIYKVPDLSFHEVDAGSTEASIAVIGPSELRQAAIDHIGGDTEYGWDSRILEQAARCTFQNPLYALDRPDVVTGKSDEDEDNNE